MGALCFGLGKSSCTFTIDCVYSEEFGYLTTFSIDGKDVPVEEFKSVLESIMPGYFRQMLKQSYDDAASAAMLSQWFSLHPIREHFPSGYNYD